MAVELTGSNAEGKKSIAGRLVCLSRPLLKSTITTDESHKSNSRLVPCGRTHMLLVTVEFYNDAWSSLACLTMQLYAWVCSFKCNALRSRLRITPPLRRRRSIFITVNKVSVTKTRSRSYVVRTWSHGLHKGKASCSKRDCDVSYPNANVDHGTHSLRSEDGNGIISLCFGANATASCLSVTVAINTSVQIGAMQSSSWLLCFVVVLAVVIVVVAVTLVLVKQSLSWLLFGFLSTQ